MGTPELKRSVVLAALGARKLCKQEQHLMRKTQSTYGRYTPRHWLGAHPRDMGPQTATSLKTSRPRKKPEARKPQSMTRTGEAERQACETGPERLRTGRGYVNYVTMQT